MATTIVLLVHRHARPFDASTYTARYLVPEWERLGFRVAVAHGTETRVPGDVAVNHVDLTVTPEAYRDYLHAYPIVLNRALVDISKPRVSAQLLRPTDPWEGPVIVKTRANYGGLNEAAVAWRAASPLGRLGLRARSAMARARGWAGVRTLDAARYPRFDGLAAVPRAIWRNPDLVVEKFLPERDASGGWCLRAWSFLGTRSLHVRTVAPDPVVRGASIHTREILPDGAIPPALLRLRARFGADFGRIDYALVDGEPVVYDVNRTPTTSAAALRAYARNLTELARGILDYEGSPESAE